MAKTNRPGRGKCPPFTKLEHCWAKSPQFYKLSPKAVTLLIHLACSYNGSNNGNLSAAYVLMKPKGWKSKGTLYDALHELQEAGWLRVTRQGGKNRCSLYALTVFAIDECKGIHDAKPTTTPPNDWKIDNRTRPADQCTRPADQSGHMDQARSTPKQHDYPPSGPIKGIQLPAQRTPL